MINKRILQRRMEQRILNAIRSNRYHKLRKLLKSEEGKKLIDYRDNYDRKFLSIACSSWSKPGILDILIKYDRQALFDTDRFGETPLHIVCGIGTVSILKKLLKYPGVKDLLIKQSKLGYVPASMACLSVYRFDILKEVLKYPEGQRSLNSTCTFGDTPLHRVCKTKGNTEKLKELLKYSEVLQTITTKNFFGYTPVHEVCAIDDNSEMLSVLLDYKETLGTLNVTEYRGYTPVDLVYKGNCSEMKRTMFKTLTFDGTLLQRIIHNTLY